MRTISHITAVDVHTGGSPVRVVTSGVGLIPGYTMAEKRDFLHTHRDDLRTRLMYEPRGHAGMSGSIVLDPCDPRADLGVVFMEVSGWLPMCGHGTIGTVTAVLETGLLPMTEPVTEVVVEVPAGLVHATVEVQDGAVVAVSLANVAAYVAISDLDLDVPDIGRVTVDVAYGGNYYAIVNAPDLGIELVPEQSEQILFAAQRIRAVLDKAFDPVHPESPWIHGVSHVLFSEPPTGRPTRARNTVFFGENGIARDPCGTGTSARMAQLWLRGQLGVGETFVHEGLIGTSYEGRVESIAQVGEHPAVLTTVKGSAYVTGTATYMLDPRDPLPRGFGVGYGSDVPQKSP